jgi:hypothetical protein
MTAWFFISQNVTDPGQNTELKKNVIDFYAKSTNTTAKNKENVEKMINGINDIKLKNELLKKLKNKKVTIVDNSEDKVKKPRGKTLFGFGGAKKDGSKSLDPVYEKTCNVCGKEGKMRCTQCKNQYYCTIECQKIDWEKSHFILCSLDDSSKKNKISELEQNLKALLVINGEIEDELHLLNYEKDNHIKVSFMKEKVEEYQDQIKDLMKNIDSNKTKKKSL